MNKRTFDYEQFMIIKKMLNNQVYWLDEKNNYKIYKFEITKISIETINTKICIVFELYPVDGFKLFQYKSTVEVLYDNFFDCCFYSLDLARKQQYKKMLERQGSLF